MTEPTLFLTPRHPALLSGFDNQVDVLVRLQAPPQPDTAAERSPLNLAIVLDRSGSMSGQPLEEAKRCASFVIDRLGPKDRTSVVVYDNEVTLLVPSTVVTDKERLHAAIRRVDSGGMTNLHGGWLKGAEQASPHIAADTVSRVILLSDGQANEGLTDVDTIAQQCAKLAEAGVSTSTYGLGRDFNEDLMIQMARAGQGNSYYGRTAEDLMDPFQEEFDLLAALYAKQVRLSLSSPEGMSVNILNQFTRDAGGFYRLPDLAFEGEAWALARVTVPKALAGNGDGSSTTHVVTVAATFQDLDGDVHELRSATLELPSQPSSAWNAVVEDELVARRVAELEAAAIQDQAQRAARNGDWPEVRRLLAQARKNAKDNEWLTEVADKLQSLADQQDQMMFSKEAMYSSHRMRSRLAMSVEPEALHDAAPSYLRRKTEQGKANRTRRNRN
jgi:Ca-activated chloride channel family protein